MPPGHFIHQSVEHGAGHLVVLFMLYKTAKVHVFSRPKSEQMIVTDRPTIVVVDGVRWPRADRRTGRRIAVGRPNPDGGGRSIDRHFSGAEAI